MRYAARRIGDYPNPGDGRDWHNYRRELNRWEALITRWEGEISWMDNERLAILKTILRHRMEKWGKR